MPNKVKSIYINEIIPGSYTRLGLKAALEHGVLKLKAVLEHGMTEDWYCNP